jgi:hypothetical protein
MTTALTEETRGGPEGLPEDLEPLTASASGGGFSGAYGESFFEPGDAELTIDGEDQDSSNLDPAAVDEAIANSRAMRLILDGGVLNGDFRQGPPNPSDPIGPNNPLPGWRYGGGTGLPGDIDSSEGLSIYWREDDDGSGYGPHIECVADEALSGEVYEERYVYVEQLVPIASRERVLLPRALCSYDGGSALLAYIEGTPYYLDGGTAGETHISEQGFGGESVYASGGPQLHQTPVEAAAVITPNPYGGQFLLIRLMFYTNNWVSSPPETSKVYEVTNAKPTLATWSGGYGQTNLVSATGSTDIWWYDESNATIPTAARSFISFSTGWCTGIGMRTGTARTGGNYAVSGYALNQGNCIGGAVNIDAAHDGFNADFSYGYLYARSAGPYFADTTVSTTFPGTQHSLNGPRQWNIFSGGERLGVKGHSHGAGNFTPTGVDGMAYPNFVMVIEDGADGSNP